MPMGGCACGVIVTVVFTGLPGAESLLASCIEVFVSSIARAGPSLSAFTGRDTEKSSREEGRVFWRSFLPIKRGDRLGLAAVGAGLTQRRLRGEPSLSTMGDSLTLSIFNSTGDSAPALGFGFRRGDRRGDGVRSICVCKQMRVVIK